MKVVLNAAAAALWLAACGSNGQHDSDARDAADNPAPVTVPGPSASPAPGVGKTTAYCDSIVGGSKVTTSFTQGCLECGIVDAGKVADDIARTYAALTVNLAPTTQGGAVRVTAQSGTVYTAGRNAGVFITIPNQPSGTQVQVGSTNSLTLKTYLGGILQEQSSLTGTPKPRLQAVSGDADLPQSYYSFTTTKMFDAVELFISNSQTTLGAGGAGGTPPYKIYELCSDGGLR